MDIRFLALSVVLSLVVSRHVSTSVPAGYTFLLWVLAVFFLFAAFWGKRPRLSLSFPFSRLQFLLFTLLIILPSVVRIAQYDLTRLHGDDAITAYFSAHTDLLRTNIFSAVPPNKGQWVSQFPTPFFLFQKLFFLLFGESFLTIKLSVIPYVVASSFFLFFIAWHLVSFEAAILATLLSAFFAPSLYLETLGLHFVSSTAVYLAFFSSLLFYRARPSPIRAILSGVLGAACFLFYISSYIALPVLFLFFLSSLIHTRRAVTFFHALVSFFAFLVALNPFLTYASTQTNYFTARTDQMSLLTGTWSGEREKIQDGKRPLVSLWENTRPAILGLFRDGIGGQGGYDFGHFSFFDPFTLTLFLTGFLLGLFSLRRIPGMDGVFLTLLLSWGGVLFSIPPAAYHRFSLAFPFLCILFSLPFRAIFSLSRVPRFFRVLAVLSLLLAFIISNENRFFASVSSETNKTDILLSSFITRHFPGRDIFVASFPGYVFEKIYYFSENKTAETIQTGYHDTFIQSFDPSSPFLYVIIFPESFEEKFAALDRSGRIIRFSPTYSLFVR